MNYILWANDTESAPVDERSVREAIAANALSPETLARRESDSKWQPIRELLPKPPAQRPVVKSASLVHPVRDANYHIPICFKCNTYVQPLVVNQTHTGRGFGIAIPTEIGFVLSQRTKTTNELVKLCPKCGERVVSQEEIDDARVRAKKGRMNSAGLGTVIMFAITFVLSLILICWDGDGDGKIAVKIFLTASCILLTVAIVNCIFVLKDTK